VSDHSREVTTIVSTSAETAAQPQHHRDLQLALLVGGEQDRHRYQRQRHEGWHPRGVGH
jgi:hypothetical protein